jgi:tRNA-2-methylthio-N6-dimethylallyladenosine synthase
MAPLTYHITTFGCQANKADSERIAADLENRGYQPAKSIKSADHVVINTCMVRQMAEDRVYGLYHNLVNQKNLTGKPQKIIITGCMVGAALREPTGKYFAHIRERLPQVDEFLPIEEVGFDHNPLRTDNQHAWVPISNGCNNFCTFCIVPFSRGREISRPFTDILEECRHLVDRGSSAITLIGQNVNSYGADLLLGADNVQTLRDTQDLNFFTDDPQLDQVTSDGYQLPDGQVIKPTIVNHLGKIRIPTLFPQLLETLCTQFPQLARIEFISSNPWDFSDYLIQVIAKHSQISRTLHLPVQAGNNRILKKMNRWYTREQYLELVDKIKTAVSGVQITTDIIVGFPTETKPEFQDSVEIAQQVGFTKAYVARYSPRPGTAATTAFPDDIPAAEKKRRWKILDELINR